MRKYIVAAIAFYITFIYVSSSTPYPPCSSSSSSPSPPLPTSADVLIVGLGASGSIVAAMLANEFPSLSFVVLESGPKTGNTDNVNISDPSQWLHVLRNESLEWGFQSTPQEVLDQRIIQLGFARMTGGSAAHNAMGYVRGCRGWMDEWESMHGCAGWNSGTLVPAFEEFEQVMNMVAPVNDTGGLVDAIFEAANSLGYPYVSSYNDGPDMYGIGNFVMSINDLGEGEYRRVTSYQKYIEEPGTPANLQIITEVLVDRLITMDNQQVVAAIVYNNERECEFVISVNQNIILSAGTIQTPAILQRSGIGNATYLGSIDIEPILDLPGVGQNLRDDVVINAVFVSNTIPIASPPASFLSAVLFAVDNQTVSSQPKDSILESLPPLPTPSFSFPHVGHLTNVELLFSTGNMVGNTWPSDWQNALVLSPNVQQCESRGTVNIVSWDPLQKPNIDTAYLT